MNDFFHPSKTAPISDTVGETLEIFAKLLRDGHRSSEKIVALALPIKINAAEHVVDGFLLEAGDAEKLVRLAKRLEILDGLDAETIVDFFCRLRPDTGNFHKPGQAGRNFFF